MRIKYFIMWSVFGLPTYASVAKCDDNVSSGGSVGLLPSSLKLCIDPLPDAKVHLSKPPEKIKFEETEYETTAALPILMDAARKGPTERREEALRQLRSVRRGLRGTALVPELIALYDALPSERKAQIMILRCLLSSRDPRGFELFGRIKSSTDSLVRFAAAIGLASANERTGVEILIGLLDNEDKHESDRTLAELAFIELRGLNDDHQWGCPYKSFTSEIEQLAPRVSDQEALRLYKEKWQSWFSENKSRFPTWEPGDALPSNSCEK